MEYKIIKATFIDDLVRLVQNAIEAGYSPQGGHSAIVVRQQNVFSGSAHTRTDNTIEYSQTVTKP